LGLKISPKPLGEKNKRKFLMGLMAGIRKNKKSGWNGDFYFGKRRLIWRRLPKKVTRATGLPKTMVARV
jgi:hypothetical protein